MCWFQFRSEFMTLFIYSAFLKKFKIADASVGSGTDLDLPESVFLDPHPSVACLNLVLSGRIGWFG